MNIKEIIKNNLLETNSELIQILDLKLRSYKREVLEPVLFFLSAFLYVLFKKEKRMTLAIMNDGILFVDVQGHTVKYIKKIQWNDLSKFNFKITKKKLLLSSYCKYNIYFEINKKKYKSYDYFIINDTENRLSRERNLKAAISNETYKFLANQSGESKN